MQSNPFILLLSKTPSSDQVLQLRPHEPSLSPAAMLLLSLLKLGEGVKRKQKSGDGNADKRKPRPRRARRAWLSMGAAGGLFGAVRGERHGPSFNLIKSRSKSHSDPRAFSIFVRKGRDKLTPNSGPNLFSLLFKFSHFLRFQHFLVIKRSSSLPAHLPLLSTASGQMLPPTRFLKISGPASPFTKIGAKGNC